MPLTLPYAYGLTAVIYMTTCLVCAAVRWFHMCQPYDRNPKYYYPGRPFVTCAWLSSLVLVPYILFPESVDAWFLTRLYFLPVTLFHFILILFSYFGSVMQWKKWKGPTFVAGTLVVVALGIALVLAIIPGDQLADSVLAEYALYILGILITGICIASMAIVMAWAGRFDPDDYSNPDDFPVRQARRWLAMVIANAVLCWTGALLDSPAALAVIMLLIAVGAVVFVITALHPNRSRSQEDEEPAHAEKGKKVYKRKISPARQAEILAAVITVVEEQEAFLDPHLTLQDVADRCGYGRTYISGLVKSELGGFVNYVNRLRLSYVDHYLKLNPGATLSEAIDAAGFGSRPAYYAIKGK